MPLIRLEQEFNCLANPSGECSQKLYSKQMLKACHIYVSCRTCLPMWLSRCEHEWVQIGSPNDSNQGLADSFLREEVLTVWFSDSSNSVLHAEWNKYNWVKRSALLSSAQPRCVTSCQNQLIRPPRAAAVCYSCFVTGSAAVFFRIGQCLVTRTFSFVNRGAQQSFTEEPVSACPTYACKQVAQPVSCSCC